MNANPVLSYKIIGQLTGYSPSYISRLLTDHNNSKRTLASNDDNTTELDENDGEIGDFGQNMGVIPSTQ